MAGSKRSICPKKHQSICDNSRLMCKRDSIRVNSNRTIHLRIRLSQKTRVKIICQIHKMRNNILLLAGTMQFVFTKIVKAILLFSVRMRISTML